MKITTFAAPDMLKADVECIRITEHTEESGTEESSEEELAINVCINGLPGIVFQHHEGYSPLQSIKTRSGGITFHGQAPTLFVYGQNTQRGVMNYQKGPFTSTQLLLKPHALRTLLGVNAAELTNRVIPLNEFINADLNGQMLEAKSEQERLTLLTNFFVALKKRPRPNDAIIEESLRLMDAGACCVRIPCLLERFAISQSQFERRFMQSVGVSPHFYLRVRRFNQAMKLMKSNRFERLTDLAHSLNFYDQSHFIRDIKEFSGLTPRGLTGKAIALYQDQGGYFYT